MEKYKRICMQCGKEFKMNRNSKGKFCSQQCYQQHRKENKIKHFCCVCGVELSNKRRLSKQGKHFCKICLREFLAKHLEKFREKSKESNQKHRTFAGIKCVEPVGFFKYLLTRFYKWGFNLFTKEEIGQIAWDCYLSTIETEKTDDVRAFARTVKRYMYHYIRQRKNEVRLTDNIIKEM